MKQLQLLFSTLEKEEKLHQDIIYNYAIPSAWNLYGYSHAKNIRSKEILVNPYSFYLFTLRHILKDEQDTFKKALPFMDVDASKGSWLKKSSIYSLMIRSASSWDHDRDDIINHDNLYHLSDNGTFLKSILLLPYLKRMGVDTILLNQPFTLGKTQYAHAYPVKEAVYSFQQIDEQLQDPLVPSMDAKQQCIAFIEACHLLGIRVILEYCPAKLARDNAYIKEHSDWFYWIKEDALANYHAPVCNALPQNTLPYEYALKDFYKSEEVLTHMKNFKVAPRLNSEKNLKEVEEHHHVSIAPFMSDQINANIPCDFDTTVFRFYQTPHAFALKLQDKDQAPYLLQDTIRCDLYSGKLPIQELWTMLCDNVTWYQKELGIDGIYLAKTYLLPEKLQKDIVKTARKANKKFALIAEDTTIENSSAWIAKGYDAISGNSGYEESNIWDFKFHSFAYRLKGNPCPTLVASEFFDSRRISSIEDGRKLAIMLTVMNHFLPNGIPMMLNGIECFEVQPLQLSEYGDQKYLYSLPKEDSRYHKQAYLDPFYFNYRSSYLNVLPILMERCSAIRREYIEAICNDELCIPAWFDSPKDYGIGFTYIKDDSALLVICNTNIHDATHLHVHTENLYSELPFAVSSVRQIYSTEDPFVHDIMQDQFRNLSIDFASGEVKFIEFKS